MLQRPSVAALTRELERAPGLLEICGFDPLPQHSTPKPRVEMDPETGLERIVRPETPVRNGILTESAFLRVRTALEAKTRAVSAMTERWRAALMEALPGSGTRLGYGGKVIESHSTHRKDGDTQQISDPDARWGKHETVSYDSKTGQPRVMTKTGFGNKLHLIADTT